MNTIEKLYPVNINKSNQRLPYSFNRIMNDGTHFTEYENTNILCETINPIVK